MSYSLLRRSLAVETYANALEFCDDDRKSRKLAQQTGKPPVVLCHEPRSNAVDLLAATDLT